MPMPGGGLVEQAVDDVDLRLHRFQRLQSACPVPCPHPSPLAHQWLGLTPQPMNMTAKRFGNAAPPPPFPVASSAPAGKRFEPRQRHRDADAPQERRAAKCPGPCPNAIVCFIDSSSHLSAKVHRPRLLRNCGLVTMLSINVIESVPIGRKLAVHFLDHRFVGGYQAAA